MLNHAEGVGNVMDQSVSMHDKLPLVSEISFNGNSLQMNKEGIHHVGKNDEVSITQTQKRTFTAAPENWKSRAISFISESIDRALIRDDINMC